jgi:hypothetical protein
MATRRINTLHRYLRRLYGGEVEERGRPDQTVTTYQLSAPVCISGEARPEEPAIADRMVSVTPDPNRLKDHPEHPEAFRKLLSLRLELLAVPYLRFALGRVTERDLDHAVRLADKIIETFSAGANVSTRCRDNMRIVVFGLTMFEALAEELGIELPELDIEAALAASINDLMDGDRGAKNPLDEFVETCSVLAYEGRLEPNKHYTVVNDLTCLHLRSCWEIYLEHRRRVGKGEPAGGLRAIRRMLKENLDRNGYVKELDKTVTLGTGRPRTVAIDLKQAGEFLDVDLFPIENARPWYGTQEYKTYSGEDMGY